MRAHRIVSPCLLLAILGGCATWQVSSASPQETIERVHPDRVLVETRTGGSQIISAPKIEADSLAGVIPGSAPGGTALARRAIALADISAVAYPKRDMGRTIGFIVAGPALALVGLYLMGN
jgi:hypothetical protein